MSIKGEAANPPIDREIRFSLTGVYTGFVDGLPVALGVAGYGIVFGVLAREAGLSVAEATLMSATVLAGAAQLIAVELWTDPVPVVALIGTTLVVNLRYVLMGAALRPWFQHLSQAQAYTSVFFTADENWALTMGELRNGSHHGAFLLGSGMAIWVCWVIATILGATVVGAIDNPAKYGLDFVFTAVFLIIAVELWDGHSTVGPWLIAAGVAVATQQMLPGRWYILLGALAGALVAVIRHE